MIRLIDYLLQWQITNTMKHMQIKRQKVRDRGTGLFVTGIRQLINLRLLLIVAYTKEYVSLPFSKTIAQI